MVPDQWQVNQGYQMSAESEAAHFRSIVEGYGPVTENHPYPSETHDNVFVKGWGVHVHVRRPEGATEPDWYALFIAVQYWGYGRAAGHEEGMRAAFKDLREMIGAKEQD